jgi:hypothetical protein
MQLAHTYTQSHNTHTVAHVPAAATAYQPTLVLLIGGW